MTNASRFIDRPPSQPSLIRRAADSRRPQETVTRRSRAAVGPDDAFPIGRGPTQADRRAGQTEEVGMGSRRTAKVAEAVREEVSTTILFGLKDPRVKNVTVTRVEVSPDLRNAKVYVSVMGDEKMQRLSLHGLESARGFLQAKLAERVKIRYTPILHFQLDQGVKRSIEASRLLREVLPPPSDDSSSDDSSEPLDDDRDAEIEDELVDEEPEAAEGGEKPDDASTPSRAAPVPHASGTDNDPDHSQATSQP
jgi:ribosome-binding factor A